MVGLARVGSIFSLPAMDTTFSGLLLFPRGFCCLGFSLSALDHLHPGLSLFLRQYVCLGSVPLTFGLSRTESILLALDAVHPDFSVLVRSAGRLASALLACGFTAFGPSMPIRQPARVDFLLLTLGLT